MKLQKYETKTIEIPTMGATSGEFLQLTYLLNDDWELYDTLLSGVTVSYKLRRTILEPTVKSTYHVALVSDLPIPAGYTMGEFRLALDGEEFLRLDYRQRRYLSLMDTGPSSVPVLILEKMIAREMK